MALPVPSVPQQYNWPVVRIAQVRDAPALIVFQSVYPLYATAEDAGDVEANSPAAIRGGANATKRSLLPRVTRSLSTEGKAAARNA